METPETPRNPATRRRRDARAALACVLALACVPALVRGWLRLPQRPTGAGVPPPVAVDLARDPAWRLAMLPGIGRLRAQDIVADRRRNGAPSCLADLRRIPGIGPGTLNRIANTSGLRVLLDSRPVLRCLHERNPDAP